MVTGVGAVTPYGVGVGAFWDGLACGRSTARRICSFDPSGYPVRFACEVPDFDPFEHLPRALVRQIDPFARFALVAADEALAAAGLGSNPDVDPEGIGTAISSGLGAVSELTGQHARLVAGGPSRVRPYLAIALPLNMGGAQIALRHGLRGPSFSVVSACASAADSIGAAFDALRAGRADVMVAGGAEAAITPVTMAGFAAAGMLSRRNDEPERASRPFDADRDGFVVGEGAAVLVLEREGHALARGAPVLARLAGYGSTNDAYHVTEPSPSGTGAARALRLALRDAGLEPADIDHCNAHGTSTPSNDLAEARALRAVFGAHTDRVAVTSTKSAIGHLLGAAGAAEAVATVLAVAEGRVPPSLNLDRQDEACDLDVVRAAPRAMPIRAAVSNSFGFGGHNAVLVFTAS